MRLLIMFSIYFLVILSVYGATLNLNTNPEKQLLGTWKEIGWEYEKVDLNTPNNKQITKEIRNEVAKNNIVHESEIWEFLPDRKLKIHFKAKEDLIVNWKLKGRGHILKLVQYTDIEYYKISKLTDQTMVLHLNIDIEARGIAKLTFKKI